MQRTKQASKKRRMTKAAVPALGFAGLTFSLAGSAAASAAPPGEVQQRPHFAPGQFTTLSEEELADVSLATFHLANGMWTAAIAWGLTVTAQSQKRWGHFCFVFFILFTLIGLAAWYAFSFYIPPDLAT